MLKISLIINFCILISFAFYSNAQTCCSAGAPISTFLEISATKPKTIAVQLTYEYKSINLLVDNSIKLENDPRTRHGQNVGLKLDYALAKKWAVSAILPLVQQARSTVSESQSSTGIGDLSLFTQYQIYSKNDYDINATAGIKVPVGKINHKDASGIFLSPDMQSGSGSFDFLVRASISKENFLLPFLSANISGVYKNNGTNNGFGKTANFNGRSFSFGDEVTLFAGLRFLQVFKAGFFVPDVNLKMRWASANIEQGVDAPNSGGGWLSLPFGFSFLPDDTKSIRLYAELPIYQQLKGLQITTDFTIGIQLNYNLNLDKNKRNNIIDLKI